MTNVEPRETARQIAERIVGEIAAMTFDRYGNYEYDNSKVADLIEAALVSLMSPNGVPPQGEKETTVEPRETARKIAEQIDDIVQAVAELPDRTSPDDWPDAMLVTADELREILRYAIPAAVASLTADLAQAKQARDAAQKAMAYTSEQAHLEWTRANKAESDLAQARQERDTLKDERDEARLIVALINNEVIGSAGYFTSPSCVEAVQNLKLDANIARREKAAAEQARDEALLIASEATKQRLHAQLHTKEAARTALLEASEEADHDLCNLLTSADSFLSVLWHRYVPRERKDIELSRDVEMVIAELRRRSDMLRQHTKEHP